MVRWQSSSPDKCIWFKLIAAFIHLTRKKTPKPRTVGILRETVRVLLVLAVGELPPAVVILDV